MNSNMHIENMENIIEKLNMYSKDELLLFGEIKSQLTNIGYTFDLPFNSLLSEKINQIYDNFSVIVKIHDNNIIILNKNIEKYLSNSVKVSQKFDEIVK